jgi:cytochrome c biogenesis protein CcmG, thiol:disulfide interchange protein DsbE
MGAMAIAFLLPNCESSRDNPLRPGDLAPEVTLEDIRGREVHLPGDFKGKLTILHFWASWCNACADEMAALESIYVGHGKAEVVPCSIALGDSKDAAEWYLRNVKVSYPVLLDPGLKSARRYGVTGVPTTFVLGRDGVVKFRALGPTTGDTLSKVIGKLS